MLFLGLKCTTLPSSLYICLEHILRFQAAFPVGKTTTQYTNVKALHTHRMKVCGVLNAKWCKWWSKFVHFNKHKHKNVKLGVFSRRCICNDVVYWLSHGQTSVFAAVLPNATSAVQKHQFTSTSEWQIEVTALYAAVVCWMQRQNKKKKKNTNGSEYKK